MKLRALVKAMTGISAGDAQAIAASFPFSRYQTFIDTGCAGGCVPAAVAYAHPHIIGGGFDLPNVQPVFAECVAQAGLTRRSPMAALSSSTSRHRQPATRERIRSAHEPQHNDRIAGLDYTAADCECCIREMRFRETQSTRSPGRTRWWSQSNRSTSRMRDYER